MQLSVCFLLSAICGAGVEMVCHRNVHGIFTCFLPGTESEESHGTWLTLYLCLIGARSCCSRALQSCGCDSFIVFIATSLAVQFYIYSYTVRVKSTNLRAVNAFALFEREEEEGMNRKTGREILNLLDDDEYNMK